MEKIFKTLIIGLLWYAIFVFITNQPNPTEWGTFAKIIAVIIGFSIVNTNMEE
jgi:hypothetical protein